MKRMMVRRHVNPTKTRKDTPAANYSFEPLVIARPAAVLRLAGRQQMKPCIDDHSRRAELTDNEPMERSV
jgi:hypothetical protein